MFQYKGKTALITGASSGIGAAFARSLAQRGMNVVLVARSGDKLDKLAGELTAKFKIRGEVIACDLSLENAVEQVQQATQSYGLAVDLLINNAGFATFGPFEEQVAGQQHQEVMLNVTTLVDLTHAFLPAMLAQGSGGIINLASTAAFQPLPYMAIYGATKAFVLSFSEALWGEYHNKGVRIMALCPGPTDTAFFDKAGEGGAAGKMASPEQVVEKALKALEKGKSYIIYGTGNYIMVQSARFFPRHLVTLISSRMLKPRSG
jgi:short-subunit dehydrogenase